MHGTLPGKLTERLTADIDQWNNPFFPSIQTWMAEEKARFDKQKEAETMAQYQREQETLQNRALLGDEKAKMGLSFMYDPPPGAKKGT